MTNTLTRLGHPPTTKPDRSLKRKARDAPTAAAAAAAAAAALKPPAAPLGAFAPPGAADGCDSDGDGESPAGKWAAPSDSEGCSMDHRPSELLALRKKQLRIQSEQRARGMPPPARPQQAARNAAAAAAAAGGNAQQQRANAPRGGGRLASMAKR